MVTETGIDWAQVEQTPWWRAMDGCLQDPRFHAEGDVAVHTRMVVDALEAEPDFDDLPAATRRVLRWAALLHDTGKPATTRTESDGRITSDGHARVGALLARRWLWERSHDPAEREAICGLVRWHMRPGYCLRGDDPVRTVATISQSARCDWLHRLAVADTKGRRAPNTADALLWVELFAELCRERGCFDAPLPFASDHSRFVYFRTPGRDPGYAAYDDTVAEMVLMSGMPGAGKDTTIRARFADLPVVSLDRLRTELGVAPSDPQEPVVLAALDRARGYLRSQQSFVWNATNLRHELRARPIGLAADYGFRVRIVYVEAPFTRLFAQNRGRDTAVPEPVMARYLNRWEVPTTVEAHTVEGVG